MKTSLSLSLKKFVVGDTSYYLKKGEVVSNQFKFSAYDNVPPFMGQPDISVMWNELVNSVANGCICGL